MLHTRKLTPEYKGVFRRMLRLHKFYLFSESIRMKISIVTHLVHTTVNHAARSKDIIHNNVVIASISDNVTSTRSVLL